ncbi:AraC family transcriptional regulator [Methylobacterium sp. 10]|uniref:AraC family transcriptional regulator n=1 Tax=Methylobacterium sp. 10 TaxID=1101191 RepID=UPI0009DEBD8E|nr:AraC family transcriptional regulator [Methylobacterium sp. 10]
MNDIQRSFTTHSLSDGAPADAWQKYMSEVYYRLDIEVDRSKEVEGFLHETRLPDLCISHFGATAQRVNRRRAAASNDESEDYVFILPTRGNFKFQQRRNSGLVDTGSVVLLNSAEGYQVDVSDRAENVTLKISADNLRNRISWIERFCSRHDFGEVTLVPAISQLCLHLTGKNNLHNSFRVQEACIDLVTLMVDTANKSYCGETIPDSMGRTLHESIKVFLIRNSRNPKISISDAARFFGVSERLIYKTMQRFGETFIEELTNIRLREARELIRAVGKSNTLNIGQIAFICGFSTQSYFSVKYRQKFGISPRDDRIMENANIYISD